MITPEMISNALGRPSGAWDTGHASLSPAGAAAAVVKRPCVESGADRNASALRYERQTQDRNGKPRESAGYRGRVDIDPRPSRDFRNAPRNGSNSGWLDSDATKIRRGGNPILSGLKWADDGRHGKVDSARYRATKWLMSRDVATIVFVVAIVAAVVSIVLSAANDVVRP